MRHPPMLRLAAPLSLAIAASGCASSHDELDTYTIPFTAAVGAEPFDCTKSYANVGVEQATIQPQDFRLYVHDVTLVAADGTRVKLELENDGVWQRDGVALLDFETGNGTCTAGTAETRTIVRGKAVHRHDWKSLEFKVGVPESVNHLDAARAPAPLNDPGLWWSWSGGFKYARIDIATPGNPGGFYFHLGATRCTGAPASGFTCAAGNVASVSLDGFDPDASRVRIDLAAFYRDVAVNAVPDRQADFVAGCMAFAGDPECPAMMGKLGLAFAPATTAPTQSFFQVVP